eukprot:790008-Pelagomonas_calceolata.AAC.1
MSSPSTLCSRCTGACWGTSTVVQTLPLLRRRLLLPSFGSATERLRVRFPLLALDDGGAVAGAGAAAGAAAGPGAAANAANAAGAGARDAGVSSSLLGCCSGGTCRLNPDASICECGASAVGREPNPGSAAEDASSASGCISAGKCGGGTPSQGTCRCCCSRCSRLVVVDIRSPVAGAELRPVVDMVCGLACGG